MNLLFTRLCLRLASPLASLPAALASPLASPLASKLGLGLDQQSHPLVSIVAEEGGQLARAKVGIVCALNLVAFPVPLV